MAIRQSDKKNEMIRNIILSIVFFAGVTYLFIKKWGWLTTGIVMFVGLLYVLLNLLGLIVSC